VAKQDLVASAPPMRGWQSPDDITPEQIERHIPPALRGVAGVGIPEAGKIIGVSRSSIYNLIGDGQLETVKIRGRAIVIVRSIGAMFARRAA
jgi:hypothetical protein